MRFVRYLTSQPNRPRTSRRQKQPESARGQTVRVLFSRQRYAAQRRALALQPLAYVLAHLGNDLVGCVIAFERDAARSGGELFFVIAHAFGCVELVARSREVKHVQLRAVVLVVRVPVARNTATDPNHTLQLFRMRKRKSVIKSARLRETEKIDSGRVSNSSLR